MASLEVERTISKETADFLVENNLLSEIPGKKWKLSKSVLFSTTDETKTMEIPVNLDSTEALEYAGFESNTAQLIFNWFMRASEDGFETDLLDMAKSHIEDNSATCGEDWFAYMNAIGINKRLQDAIMLPGFEDIRHTASCEFWLLETIEDNYRGLQHFGQRLELKVQAMKAARSREADVGADAGPVTRMPISPLSCNEPPSISTQSTAALSSATEPSASHDAPQPTNTTIQDGEAKRC